MLSMAPVMHSTEPRGYGMGVFPRSGARSVSGRLRACSRPSTSRVPLEEGVWPRLGTLQPAHPEAEHRASFGGHRKESQGSTPVYAESVVLGVNSVQWCLLKAWHCSKKHSTTVSAEMVAMESDHSLGWWSWRRHRGEPTEQRCRPRDRCPRRRRMPCQSKGVDTLSECE
jgi:hypothetical protein